MTKQIPTPEELREKLKKHQEEHKVNIGEFRESAPVAIKHQELVGSTLGNNHDELAGKDASSTGWWCCS
ncbi:hypothetical protein [Rickettsia endosymbiont of Halotydeus destructor]|uniref:hypothetical protein n=1 Tax=Rickettsia endosymbiont of Halotydeus destructor TaxID=2996754 RepID=UPI003BB162DC